MRQINEPRLVGKWGLLVEVSLIVSVIWVAWMMVGGTQGLLPKGATPASEIQKVSSSFRSVLASVSSDIKNDSPRDRARKLGNTVDSAKSQIDSLSG